MFFVVYIVVYNRKQSLYQTTAGSITSVFFLTYSMCYEGLSGKCVGCGYAIKRLKTEQEANFRHPFASN